jgi:hypothetical protein
LLQKNTEDTSEFNWAEKHNIYELLCYVLSNFLCKKGA